MGKEGNYYELVIEQARTAEDLRQMLHISSLCHGADNWSNETFYEQLYGDSSRGGIYARVKDGDYAGILVWTIIEGRRMVDITNVGVAPAYRQLGVAKLLFEVFLNMLFEKQIFTSATLHVAVENFPALALYTKYGFEIRKEIPGYYNPGDAYSMKAYITTQWPYSCEVMEQKATDSFSMTNLAQSLMDIDRSDCDLKAEYEGPKYGDDTLMNEADVEVIQREEIMADPILKIKPVTFRLKWHK
eukprot:TRINITY_DN11657_c0_g1_i1.p1 TRINITY_DN11657_c0_g1~~TRINITY_DN11657_c0_g1_i1.p1  ORF type:complete len:244 (+),score=19.65 TRINITY_DN11657_c0_g1_i1:40-771(+)